MITQKSDGSYNFNLTSGKTVSSSNCILILIDYRRKLFVAIDKSSFGVIGSIISAELLYHSYIYYVNYDLLIKYFSIAKKEVIAKLCKSDDLTQCELGTQLLWNEVIKKTKPS